MVIFVTFLVIYSQASYETRKPFRKRASANKYASSTTRCNHRERHLRELLNKLAGIKIFNFITLETTKTQYITIL